MTIILTIITAFMWLSVITGLTVKANWADALAATVVAISSIIGLVGMVVITLMVWGGNI